MKYYDKLLKERNSILKHCRDLVDKRELYIVHKNKEGIKSVNKELQSIRSELDKINTKINKHEGGFKYK